MNGAAPPAPPPPGEPRRPRQSLVLSGGGANGAYEVGVIKALLTGGCPQVGPVAPDHFIGTSVGSFNAAFLVGQWEEFGAAAAANLERTWLETVAGDAGRNGVYRFRGDPTYFLNPLAYMPNPLRPLLELGGDGAYLSWQGMQRMVHLATAGDEDLRERIANLFDFSAFISLEPWARTIRSAIDFAAIRRCPSRQLRVPATNWATGELRIFANHDMTDHTGPLAVLASTAIPGVFPPVNIGAEPYVDGGVLLNTPLRPALDPPLSADVIYVVYLDPDVASIPLSTLSSTIAASYRLQTISWAALMNAEIERARRINRGLAVLQRIRGGEAVSGVSEEIARSAVLVLGGEHLETYRPITIHRFSPADELSSGALGLLNLERGHIDELIQKGFTDTKLHDCRDQKCVLPDPRLLAAGGSLTVVTGGER
jgi:NTE family protein